MNGDLKEKNIVRLSALNFLRQIVNFFFPLLSFSYATRILGKDGIGMVSFSNTLITLFVLLATLGITNYGAREAAKCRDDRVKLSKLTKEILLINLVTTIMSYILFFICIFCFDFAQRYKGILLVMGPSILLNGLGVEWLYMAVEDYGYITVRTCIFKVISLFALFCFVKRESDVIVYAAIYMISNSGSYLLNFFRAQKYVDIFTPGKVYIYKHFKPIFLLFALTLSIELYTCLDSVMLGVMTNDSEVGLYTAGVKANKVVNALIISLGAVLLPRLSFYIEKKKIIEFQKLVYNAFQMLFFLSVPASVCLFLFAKQIIIVLGGDGFIYSVPIMRVLVPIVLVIPFSTLVNMQLFIPMHMEKYILMSTCSGAIINFIFNIILIPHRGAMGAAISTVVAETVVAMICCYNVNKMVEIRTFFLNVRRYSFCSALFVAIYVVANIFLENERMQMLVTIAVGGILYLAILRRHNDECLSMIYTNIFRRKNEN